MSSDNPSINTGQLETQEVNQKKHEIAVEIRKSTRQKLISYKRTMNKVRQQQLQQHKADSQIQKPVHLRPNRHSVRQDMLRTFNQSILNIHSGNPELMVEGIMSIKKLSSVQVDPPIQQILDSGVLPFIMHVASQDQNKKLKTAAGCILLNMCSGTSEQVMSLIDKGMLKILTNYLQSDDNQAIQNAVWSFGNISAEENLVKIVVDSPIIQEIIKVIQRVPSHTLIMNAGWCLSNICRSKARLTASRVGMIAPVLMSTLSITPTTDDIFFQILWGLSNISAVKSSHQVLMLESNLVKVSSFLREPNKDPSITATLILLSNLCCNEQQSVKVFSQWVYFSLMDLILNPKDRVKKEALCLVANGCKHSGQVALQIANNEKFMGKLLAIAQKQSDTLIKQMISVCREMALILPPHTAVRVFTTYEIMRALVIILIKGDPILAKLVLQTIDSLFDLNFQGPNPFITMFNCHGGAQQLQKLQQHQSDDIYELSLGILEKHYDLQSDVM